MDFVSLEEARAYIVRTGDHSQDDEVERAVEFAERLVKDNTGRDFLYAQRTETLSGNGASVLFLKEYPVTEVVSVSILNSAGEWETQDIADFVVDPAGLANAVWWRRGFFPRGIANVQVTVKSGYAAEDLPATLRECVLVIARKYFEDPDRKSSDVASVSREGQTIVYRDRFIPIEASRLLRSLRRLAL